MGKMPLAVDYSATDATFWRAAITDGSGARVLGIEVRRAGTGITRAQAMRYFVLMVRSLRPSLDQDHYLALIRALEMEASDG
jgi:hypothetical protein